MIDWQEEAAHWRSRWEMNVQSIAKKDRKIQILMEHIENLEKDGHWSHEEEIDDLLSMLDERFPQWRVTHQRREIANLHKVIRRLKLENQELRKG